MGRHGSPYDSGAGDYPPAGGGQWHDPDATQPLHGRPPAAQPWQPPPAPAYQPPPAAPPYQPPPAAPYQPPVYQPPVNQPPVNQPPAYQPAPPPYQPPPFHQPPPPFHQPPGPPKRRLPLIMLTGVLAAVLALAVVAVLAIRPGPIADLLGGTQAGPSTVTEPSLGPPSLVLEAAAADAPVPSAAAVAAALEPVLKDARLGSRVTASVIDATTGNPLYAKEPDAPTTPASTIKLVTAVTVLTARGPGYRIGTVAVAGARSGEVVLVGGGDPTLAAGATGTYPGAARLDELATQVKKALGGTAPTKVIVDASLFTGGPYGPGWDDDIPGGGFVGPITALMTDGARIDPKAVKGYAARHGQPDIAAGRALAKALGLPNSAVSRGKAPAGSAAQPSEPAASSAASASPASPVGPGTLLGRVESPTISRLVEMMLVESDNVIAEMLARQVALARSQPASYAGASTAMTAVLGELGLPGAGAVLADGSGLSRTDRVTPALLTAAIALATRPDKPELHGIFSGLPVAGYSGTLRDRYRSPGPSRPGAGIVRAKTGTLRGVSAISGVVVTKEGRLLAFAVLADAVPASGTSGAQETLDRAATTLATADLSP